MEVIIGSIDIDGWNLSMASFTCTCIWIIQIQAGQKICVVAEIGISRGCRNDEVHKSASLELCPVDTKEVSAVLFVHVWCLKLVRD